MTRGAAARTLIATAIVVSMVAVACGGGDSGKRVVLVDFSHDEFATFALANFPNNIAVTQGQTVEFRQTWTGEPHTITGGASITGILRPLKNWLTLFDTYGVLRAKNPGLPDPENAGNTTFAEFAAAVKVAQPRDVGERFVNAWRALRAAGVGLPDLDTPPATPLTDVNKTIDEVSNTAFEGLGFAMDNDGNITQNLGQPCYLRTGTPPEDPGKPCAKVDQRQPAFDGTHAFYNSGILPYEGPRGNTYRVPIAADAKPGTYLFYCAIHGPSQMTTVEVRRRGAKVPSQHQVTREARNEIDDLMAPLEKVYRSAHDKGEIDFGGRKLKGPFAGLASDAAGHVAINEFLPKRLTVKAGEPVTWRMMGSDHTITFDVPKYFPIVDFKSTGGIRMNPKLRAPAGGAPPMPEQQGQGPVKIDGGTYDGDGFWSTGVVGAQPFIEYTLRVSKPGTYDYACLIHPPMVGKLVVTAG
ncbi:MAG: hypothetical protein H0W70_05980 [Actinobacteria bacterium]|nr:hypothetical protein [Actinomycetota bacterium]